MSVSGPDLELANRLRSWLNPIGVRVVEIDGWRARGRTYARFDPQGSVNHHTAGPRLGVAPSLGICINGRSDLPGPLCNVHQQRDDVVNVVAAGVANHAGPGGWSGISGNQHVFGLEVEHCGYADEPFSDRRYQTSLRIHAAFLSGLDHPNPALLSQHFEWSTMGKIDFVRTLLRGGAQGFRNDVANLLKVGPGQGQGTEPQNPEEAMPMKPDITFSNLHADPAKKETLSLRFNEMSGQIFVKNFIDNKQWWPLAKLKEQRNVDPDSYPSGTFEADGSLHISQWGRDGNEWHLSRYSPNHPDPKLANTWSDWWTDGVKPY